MADKIESMVTLTGSEYVETLANAHSLSEEVKRYRKTLRDIVRQCNNPIHTSPAGMDRIIERIEEMAIDALGYQPPNNNPLKAD